MAEAKIHFSIGHISFSGEGDQAWLSEQIDKILDPPRDLVTIAAGQPAIAGSLASSEPEESKFPATNDIATQSLPSFLKSNDAGMTQKKKFLATAVWLHAKGQDRLNTAGVNEALRNASQSKLANASDSLNRNVRDNCCVKDGKTFFVTPEGKQLLGL